jgi:hypothetical protein
MNARLEKLRSQESIMFPEQKALFDKYQNNKKKVMICDEAMEKIVLKMKNNDSKIDEEITKLRFKVETIDSKVRFFEFQAQFEKVFAKMAIKSICVEFETSSGEFLFG